LVAEESSSTASPVEICRRALAALELQLDLADFELVDAAESSGGVSSSTTAVPPPAFAPPVRPACGSASEPRPTKGGEGKDLTWEEREAYARAAGYAAHRRALGLRSTSPSTEKSSLQPAIYVVLRDKSGNLFNPAKAFNRWGPVKELCCNLLSVQGRSYVPAASSVFEGFASQKEILWFAAGAGIDVDFI
jgi:hypothetical protein